jgi:DNA-binding NarL/FixJ family response regulator
LQPNSLPQSQSNLPKLLVGDDHQLVLDALGAMMKNEFDVIAVNNGQAFINAAENIRPDIALLDVSMPGGDGFVAARKVHEQQPELPIVFLSMHSDSSYVDQAAEIGARAYLSKRLPAQELLATLKIVLEGGSLLEPAKNESPSKPEPGKNDLTGRQREVLRLIAIGCSAKDIANRLNISVRTAEFHRAAIMQRLGLHSTAQMTRYAIAKNIA